MEIDTPQSWSQVGTENSQQRSTVILEPIAVKVLSGDLELVRSGDGFGRRVGAEGYMGERKYGVVSFAPFTLGVGEGRGVLCRNGRGRRKNHRRPRRRGFVPPELGKRSSRGLEQVGELPGLKRRLVLGLITVITAEADGVQSRRAQ